MNKSRSLGSCNSNQKLSLPDRSDAQWVGFLSPTGMCTSELVTQRCFHRHIGGGCFILSQNEYPHWPDKTHAKSGHFSSLSHGKSLGWAVQLQVGRRRKQKKMVFAHYLSILTWFCPRLGQFTFIFFLYYFFLPKSKIYLALKRTCSVLCTPVRWDFIWKQIPLN